MTRKHANKKDSAENNQEELSALIRSIKLSQKYFLFFVACNQITRQNELIAEIKAELPTKNVEVINFREPITNLLNELKQILKDKNPDAIFVQGLGNSISSDGISKENALIHSLNLTRDLFNDAFQCPIYLWLPKYAVIKITRNAPDYFSVRSGVFFYFSSTAEQVISDIFQNTSAEWLEVSSLPLAEKQKRIANLESLLAEYQGLPEVKRDKRAEMRLYEQLAGLFSLISDYRKAIAYYTKALLIAEEIGSSQGKEIQLGNLGTIYCNLGEYRKAIEYYEKALFIAKEIGDRQGECFHLSNLGIPYRHLREYRKAIEYYEKALFIAKEIGDRQGEGSNLGNLGIAYNQLGEYHKAIDYCEQALIISKEIGNRQGEGSKLGNLGIAYFSLGDYHKAIDYYEQSLIISKEIGDRQGEGTNLVNLGNAYYSLGVKEAAKDYYLQALSIFEAIESPNAEVVRRNLARLE